MLAPSGLGSGGRLLPIILALLLAPGGTLLQVEPAVVIGVDLVEALAIEPVAFRLRHRRQLIVIGLAALEARLFGCRKAGGGQLARQPGLPLRQIVQPEIAVLFKGDQLAGGGLRWRALRCCGQMPPSGGNEGGYRRGKGPWSHQRSPYSGPR